MSFEPRPNSDNNMEVSEDAVHHAVSGGVAGALALLIFYPLDVARTIIQVHKAKHPPGTITVIKDLVAKYGWSALYDGVGPNLITMFTSQFIYFYTYNGLKQLVLQFTNQTQISTVPNIIVASAAGVINVLATAPMWVAATRMKMQRDKPKGMAPYSSIFDAIYNIAKDEGIGGLWNGTAASIVLVSNPVIHFVTYEQTKYSIARFFYDNNQDKLSSYSFFFIAAWAKFITTWSTYPLQILQNRLRVRKKDVKKDDTLSSTTASSSTFQATLAEVNMIYAEGGVAAFYKGIHTKLLQTVLTAAFMFASYEKLHEALTLILKKQV